MVNIFCNPFFHVIDFYIFPAIKLQQEHEQIYILCRSLPVKHAAQATS
jgi:hypothetical protein